MRRWPRDPSAVRDTAEALLNTHGQAGIPDQVLTQVQGFMAGDDWSGASALRPLYAGFLREAAELDGLADLIDPNCPPGELAGPFAGLAATLDSLALDEEAAAKELLGAVD